MENPRSLVEVLRSGGVFYGGLIAATAVGIWYMRKHRLPAWKIADMGAPSIALGEAIGRWGCFAAGCCYGSRRLTLRLSRSRILRERGGGTPERSLHPTQLYLSLNALLIFSCPWAYRRRTFDGEVFWLYVLLYAITRGIIETFRGDSSRGFLIPGVMSTSQFIGLVAAATAVGMLVYLSRRRRAAA